MNKVDLVRTGVFVSITDICVYKHDRYGDTCLSKQVCIHLSFTKSTEKAKRRNGNSSVCIFHQYDVC